MIQKENIQVSDLELEGISTSNISRTLFDAVTALLFINEFSVNLSGFMKCFNVFHSCR